MASHRLCIAVAVGLLAVPVAWTAAARAANVTWDGSDSTAWNTGGNWTLNAAPATGDFLFFTSGNQTNQPSNNDASGLTLSGLTFLDATFTGPLSLGGNSLTLSATTTSGVNNFSRTSTTTVTVTQADHGLVTGQYVTFATGSSNFNTTAQVTVLTGSTFTYVSSSNAAATITGTYTPATLNNLNTTAGRDVTIGNALTIMGTQFWAAPNASAVTSFSGNLSGTAGSSITVLTNDTKTALPSIRLSGNNAGYLGNILTTGNNTSGVMLVNADAMIGGYITLNSTDQGIWLNGSATTNGGIPVGTYTFLPGKVAAGVESRNQGTSNGIHVTGGDITWRPGNTSAYTTTTGTLMGGLIRIGPQATGDTTTPYVINFGNVGDTISSGTFANASGSTGNGQAIFEVQSAGGNTIFNIRSALSGTGNFSLGAPLGILNAASTGSGRLTVGSGGALSINSMSQLPSGNLDARGTLILDGISWSTFAATRSSGTGANQWQSNSNANTAGFGFAARGAAVTIDSQSTDAATFDKSFSIGSGLLGSDGQLYATAGVTISADTTLTGTAARTVTVGNNGVGFGGGTPVLNRYSGNLSGTGSVIVSTASASSTPGELVLAGTNTWTGAPSASVHTGVFMNVGQGGLIVQRGLVRFESDASLPAGAPGTAYVAAQLRNESTPFGFLLTGSATTATYDLPAGYKFLIGTTGSSSPSTGGVFGVDGGKAVIQSSSLLINSNVDASMTVQLLARTGSELSLGAATQPFNIIPTVGADGTASSTATTYTNSTSTTKTLIKRGEGTITLANVGYVQLDGTTSQAARFAWQIGRGTGGNGGGSAYFDGAVRGLSPNDPAATDSNSLKNFFMALRGGVYEIDNSGGNSGTFTATLGVSGTGKVSVGNISGNTPIGGGGFSAYGGNVTVTLTAASGTTTSLQWSLSSSGFVQSSDPLMFGSETATATLDFANALDLNAGYREVRVFDNAASATDYAVMSGVLSGNSASGINKTGAGLLELSAANTYSGTTTASAGTLRIVNNLALQNSALNTSGAGAVTLTVTTPTFGGLVGSTDLSTVISSGYGSVSAVTFNPGSGLTRTYTGAIADGAAGMTVTKTGSGTQILGGANSYTGNTTISTGTLQLGVGNSLPGNIANAASLVLLQGGTGAGVASGLVSGTGTVTMSGTGVVRLSNTANTYTGKTTISSGVLEVISIAESGTASSLGMPTGANATIDLGSGSTTGLLRFVNATGLSTNRTLRLSGSTGGGGLEANGSAPVILGSVTTATAGAKVLTLAGTSTQINEIGAISGAGVSLDKTGSGLWRLTGTSSFDGQLRVLRGTIVAAVGAGLSGDSVFGTTQFPVVGDTAAGSTGQAALLIERDVSINRPLTIATLGSGGSQEAVLGMASTVGTGTFAEGRTISLGRNVTLQAADGGTVVFKSVWTDTTAVVGSQPAVAFNVGSAGNNGTVAFNSPIPNSITAVNVRRGTLRLDVYDPVDNPGVIGLATPVTLGETGAAGTLNLNGVNQPLSSLSFDGVASSVVGSGTLRLFRNGSGATVTGSSGTGHVISSAVALDDATTFAMLGSSRLLISSAITGSSVHSLTKAGTGILELSGTSSYTGPTSIAAGVLAVNGRLGNTAVTVQAGATLGGSGRLAGSLTGDGLIAPGNSPGILTLDGQITPIGTTSFAFEFSGTGSPTWSDATASMNDVLRLTNVDPFTSPLTSTNLVNVYFDVTSLANGDTFLGGFYSDRMTGQLDFAAEIGSPTYAFYVLGNGSGSATNYNGKSYYSLAEYNPSLTGVAVSVVTVPTANYADGTINNGQATQFVIIPEPGAIALAGIGIAAAAWGRRHRKTLIGS